MGAGELRSIALFDGLSDAQLEQLAAAGEQVRFAPARSCSPSAGRPTTGGCCWKARSAWSAGSATRRRLARMESPGQWAGGFRAWDQHGVYLATGRATSAGRVLRVPATALRELADSWFPFGVHLIRGPGPDRPEHRVGGPAAGVAGRTGHARRRACPRDQQPGRRRRPGPRTRCRTPARPCCPRSAGSRPAGSPPSQFAALDALRREIDPAVGQLGPLAVADREDDLSDWLAAHGVERDWFIAPPLAAAGVDDAWCERAAAVLDGEALEPGWSGWRARCRRPRCSPR